VTSCGVPGGVAIFHLRSASHCIVYLPPHTPLRGTSRSRSSLSLARLRISGMRVIRAPGPGRRRVAAVAGMLEMIISQI